MNVNVLRERLLELAKSHEAPPQVMAIVHEWCADWVAGLRSAEDILAEVLLIVASLTAVQEEQISAKERLAERRRRNLRDHALKNEAFQRELRAKHGEKFMSELLAPDRGPAEP